MIRLVFIAMPAVLLAPVLGQEDSKLEIVRKHAIESDRIYRSMTASFSVTKVVSPWVVEASEPKSSCLSSSIKTVDGIWHRHMYSTKSVDRRTMGDNSKSTRTFVSAFNGKNTYQNDNYLTGSIINERVIDSPVNPRLIAAPLHLGRLGTLEQLIDIKLDDPPYASVLRYWKKFRYRHLGKEKRINLDCHKIEISRLDPNPPGQFLQRYVIWISPERNWQIAASKYFHANSDKEPMSSSHVTQWKKLKTRTWIPFSAETRHFRKDKNGKRLVSMTETYTLNNCKLTCDPNDKRFNDVGFLPKMKIQFIDIKRNKATDLQIK